MNLLFTCIIYRLNVVSFSSIIHINEFAEGWGFNALPISMVAALPITAIALALTKGWFFNHNRKGDTRNINDRTEENVMKKANSSNKSVKGNKGNALKTAIGAVLNVGYDTTVGMGAGALLNASKVSTR